MTTTFFTVISSVTCFAVGLIFITGFGFCLPVSPNYPAVGYGAVFIGLGFWLIFKKK